MLGHQLKKENYLEGKYIPEEIFIFTSHNDEHPDIKVIDSGMYACIYLDNYDDEIAYAESLKKYCKEKGYAVSGDYICEILTEFNVFDTERRSMFMRLQVPLKFN